MTRPSTARDRGQSAFTDGAARLLATPGVTTA